MVRGGHQNKPPGGLFRTAQTYIHVMSFAGSFPFAQSSVGADIEGVAATHGSMRPSEQTACGSLQRMVRGGHRNTPSLGHFSRRVSLVLVAFLSGATSEQTSLEVTATHRSLRPSEQTSLGSLQRMVRGGHQNRPAGVRFRR